MNKSFLREVKILPAFDKTSDDPKKDFGVHGADILFKLRCIDDGAVLVFELFSGWMLPHVQERFKNQGYHSNGMGSSVIMHKPATTDDCAVKACQFVGGPCTGNYGFLIGSELFDLLIAEGSDALWTRMEALYHDWF